MDLDDINYGEDTDITKESNSAQSDIVTLDDISEPSSEGDKVISESSIVSEPSSEGDVINLDDISVSESSSEGGGPSDKEYDITRYYINRLSDKNRDRDLFKFKAISNRWNYWK